MSPLLVAMLVVLCEGLCVGMVFPVLAFFVKSLSGSEIAVGLIFALAPLPKIVSNSVFGRWSDRVGRKRVLIVATIGGILGSLLWAQATSLWLLAAARLVTGIFGVHATLAQAIAVDVTRPEKRAASVGLLGASFGTAISLGPLLGGWIASTFSYAALGYVMVGVQFISLTLIIAFLRDQQSTSRDTSETPPPAFRDIFHTRGIPALLAVMLTTTMASMILLTALGPFVDSLFDYDTRDTGILLGTFGIVGVIIQGGVVRPLVANFGEWPICLCGTAILGLGYAIFGIADAEWLLFAAVVVVGIGASLLAPTQTAQLSRRISDAGQGSLLGLNQGITSLGRVSGAAIAGALMIPSLRLPFFFCVGLAALAVAAVLIANPQRKVAIISHAD